MPFYSSLRLRGKLVSILLLFGLAPTLLVFSIFMFHQKDYRHNRMLPLKETARAMNDVIDRNLFERYGDVQAFALNTALRNPSNLGNVVDDNPLIKAMNGYMANYGIYQLMLVVSPEGKLLATNTKNAEGAPVAVSSLLDRDFSQESWFRKAFHGDFLQGANGLTGTVVEQPRRVDYIGRMYNNDGFVIPFVAPVKNDAGQIMALWVNFADFSLVEQILDSFYQQAKAEGMPELEIALVNSEGVMLSDFDPGEGKGLGVLRDWTVLGIEKITDHFPQVKPVLSRQAGTVITVHDADSRQLAAGYAPSVGALGFPGLGWAVVAQVPADSMFSALNDVVYIIVGIVVLSVVLIIIGGLWVGRGFARPMQQISAAMMRLSHNEMDITLTIPREDEIGELSKAYEVFRQNAIARSQEMGRMQAIESRVKEVAQGINQATREISEGNANLSERTEAQAANVEETTASMQQITATVAASADNARDALSLASAARSAADKGGEVAGFAMSAMQDISDSSSRIVDIIGVIDNIAFQTNLLALNAAVEAARAGEQGRGFAVVASEVRALANRSAAAAKEIKGLISESVEKINSGVTQVSETANCLTDIINNVQQVTTVVGSIATASAEQASSIAELNKAVAQMDAFTQQNAALVEEAAAASKALEDQTSSLVKAVS